MATVAEMLALAVRHHQSGDFYQAEQLYRQILQVDPEHFDALHLLGLIAHQTGHSDAALDCLTHALRLRPDCAEAHYNLGIVLKAAGRVEEAVASYQQALRLKPNNAAAHNNLGEALITLGRREEAVASYRQALRLKPDHAGAHNNLGIALKEQGMTEVAMASYRQALRLKPDFAEAHNNLGVAFLDLGRVDEAAASYLEALRLRPNYAEAHNNLGAALKEQGNLQAAVASHLEALRLKPDYAGAHDQLANALREQGRLEEALASCQEALRLRPNLADAHNSLGLVLLEQGRPEEAVASHLEALRLKPDLAEAHNNLGNAYGMQGRLEEAVASYRQALRLKPDFAPAHVHLGMTLLLLGDFEQGWAEYEWRRQYRRPALPSFPQPGWDGSDLAGKTILLFAEQGLGDTLQFIRYAPLVKQRGGTVLVACQRPLVRLLATCPGIDRLAALGSELPPFDVQTPLLSLPRLFRTSAATVPAAVPYLSADLALAEHWRRELAAVGGFKVGIAWQASHEQKGARRRSAPLAQFAPLARVPGVKLVSLQKGPGAEQLRAGTCPFPVIDLGDGLDEAAGPFMDTAGVMKGLDLVITIDTAVPHLAGALGVPVWVALPLAPDWRWLPHGEGTPWYPSMRLFRQAGRDDWAEVFERMSRELAKLV